MAIFCVYRFYNKFVYFTQAMFFFVQSYVNLILIYLIQFKYEKKMFNSLQYTIGYWSKIYLIFLPYSLGSLGVKVHGFRSGQGGIPPPDIT